MRSRRRPGSLPTPAELVSAPTHALTVTFVHDLDRLSVEQRELFDQALLLFVEDLPTGTFRGSLHVRRVLGLRSTWEMTWSSGGRATFRYAPDVVHGQRHVVWRRIGTTARDGPVRTAAAVVGDGSRSTGACQGAAGRRDPAEQASPR